MRCVVSLLLCKKKVPSLCSFSWGSEAYFPFLLSLSLSFFRNIFQKPFELAFFPYFLGTEGGTQ